MKLISYTYNNKASFGHQATPDKIIDIASKFNYVDVLDFISKGGHNNQDIINNFYLAVSYTAFKIAMTKYIDTNTNSIIDIFKCNHPPNSTPPTRVIGLVALSLVVLAVVVVVVVAH